MGKRIGLKRINNAELIHVPRNVGKRIAAPKARLAVACEFPLGSQKFLLFYLAPAKLNINFLAVTLLQLRLVIKSVNGRRATIHEQKDAALRLYRKVRQFGCKRVVVHCGGVPREKAIAIEQARQRKTSETGTGLPEKLPSVTATAGFVLCDVLHRSEIEPPLKGNPLRQAFAIRH